MYFYYIHPKLKSTMKRINTFITIYCIAVYNFACKAQTPSEDPQHYLLEWHETFESLNPSIWTSPPYNPDWGLEIFHGNNAQASNGVLTLKTERVITPSGDTIYVSGGAETVHKKSFSYGYFEIEAKLPEKGVRGPWGGFWLHSGDGGIWDEIDILEPNGCDTELGHQFNIGLHATHNSISTHKADLYTGFPDLSSDYYKYALVWTPSHIKVLFEDNVVYEEVQAKYIPSHPMYLFLTAQISDWAPCVPDPDIPFPDVYWQFKNFKYYKITTNCMTSITENNFDFDNHDYAVYKFYSLSNSTVPNNTDVVLRATDYIQLDGEFYVPLGSTFTAITHHGVCPD